MRRGVLILIGVLLVLTSEVQGLTDDKEEAGRLLTKLERGMTPQQVRDAIGPPRRISRQILYHRYLEQWYYDSPVPFRLTFDCPRGQKPQLVWRKPAPTEKNR